MSTAQSANQRGQFHIGQPTDRNPESFQSRRLSNRTYRFGHWHGKREGKLYEEYQRAIVAAETLHENKQALADDENLTKAGHSAALQQDAMPLLEARLKFQATATSRREALQTKAAATLAETTKDYDTNTGQHDRLIEAYRSLPAEQRARMFADPKFVERNRELALAVYAEPQIVTRIDDSQRQYLQQALLSATQRTNLQAIDQEVQQLTTVGKAYDTARQVACDLCGMQEAHLSALEDTIAVDTTGNQSDKGKTKTLADGGVLKLADLPDNEDEDES